VESHLISLNVIDLFIQYDIKKSAMINYTVEGQIGKIILNRPDKFNSFNREMSLALQQALGECMNNKNVRAVYLGAAGKAFSAGQDLAEASGPNGLSIGKIVSEHYNPIIQAIRSIPKPVVCAVNGVAAGAGANIALSCDIVVAGKSASFIQAFSKIGLIPDSGGTFFLPRLIGLQAASALMMLGEKVSADDAKSMGMIYKVFEDADLETEALKITETLSQMPTKGIGLTKELLNRSLSNTLEDQLLLEERRQVEAGATHDFKEGVKAFLEKRKPVFSGE
jgi:2-(1,2-epoxy-1,2-dihydrophenyl)acetyl-CoA isomerase